MIDDIETNEFEISAIHRIIDNIKQRYPLYIPVKSDPIDMALAEYLNSRGGQTFIPFTREDYGIYRFGSKRVALKLENG